MHHLQPTQSIPIRPSLFSTPSNCVHPSHVRAFATSATSSGPSPNLPMQPVSWGSDKFARFTSSQTQSYKTKLYNAKIKDKLHKGDYDSSLSLYYQMLDENISPNATTFCYMFQSCSLPSDLNTLRLLHNDTLRLQLDLDASVVFGLMLAYAKCGRTDLAHQVLENMAHRDVVSWTFLIRQSILNGRFDLAIWVFGEMILAGALPDEVTLVSVLSAISRSGHVLKQGREVHGYIIRRGLQANSILIGSLVNMYAKLGKLALADRMSHGSRGNVVVWTAMIGGCLEAGDATGATKIFLELMNSGNQPTEKTISCTLRAVSLLGSSRIGMQMHGQVIKRGLKADKFVTSSLLDMYAKSGVGSSVCRKLFDEMPQRDVVCWTALISAHGRTGEGAAALRAFDDMIQAGVYPDSVTFTSLLQACCSSGMLAEGLRYFDSMIKHHEIKPREAHYACLMDLIAKGGRLEEAYKIVQSLDMRNDGRVWEVLLCACKVHGDVGLGELAAKRLLEIEPANPTRCYQLLSDIYAAVGRSEKSKNLRALTK